MQQKAPIVIIGAGVGGLSAAIRLAAAGRAVTVLEKNVQVGGKLGELRLDGYRFDTGPSVITMRAAFEDLFAAAGRQLDDYLDFQPVDPLTRYFYPDGQVLNIHNDLQATLAEIEAVAPQDLDGYRRFLEYAANLYRLTSPVFIYDRPPTLRSFTKVPVRDWLGVDGLRSMQQAIESHVQAPQLRQLLGRFATYVGASPYLAPATLNVIAHVELNQGVWYPRGGIYQIARALERLAGELGVEIRTGTRVQGIEVRQRQVRGVTLENGERLPARVVIANLDVAQVYERLLPAQAVSARRLARLTRAEPSCSGFILLLGLRDQTPELAHHNIFFSSDYAREFAEIFKQGRPPSEPTIYVAITAKSTPQDAPTDSENWFVLVNAPALGPHWDWAQQAQPYRERVLDLLAQRGFDVRSRIAVEQLWTPQDIARQSGARRGALYGASSNNRWAAFRRPHNRAPDIQGLYFAGGTTHPGGGVPMVALSGKVASELLLEDGF
ncbi:MAG: phytoene desaturase [Anaerolineales bacterium]|nr:phytoene desaturase [Anaerolineales bacterium]